MLEKLKEMFDKKNKKIENLIFLLLLLIITLVCINYIMKDNEPEMEDKYADAVLANAKNTSTSLETRIENILSEINGVRKSFCTSYIR